MVIIQPSVWISIWFIFIVNTRSQVMNTTACYLPGNSECDFFDLKCENGTKIRITGTEYRYKKDTVTKGNTDNNCCKLDANDCKENYTYGHAVVLYDKCSGKMTCLKNRAPQPKQSQCDANNERKLYIHVMYECTHDHNILDICQAYSQASEVDIIFQGTLSTTNTTATCVCYVQSQHKIFYELIDVRLFTNVTDDGFYTCLSSNFSISNSLIQCQHPPNDRSFKYMNSPNFTGEISTKRELSEVMWLTFTRDAKPEMVWVKLKADGNFSVYCNSSPSTTSTGTTITKQVTTSTLKTDVSSPGDTNEISTSKTLVCTDCTTSDDKDDHGKSIPMIIGVVVAVIIVIAVVAVAILILKRRQKLHTETNTQISELPNGLINPAYTSCKEAGDTYAVIETSTYESIIDNSALTDSKPIKNSTRRIHENETTAKNDDISAREYDRIEFEMKYTIKSSNYDFLPVVDKQVGDDTYSHVSNKSQSVTTAKSLANDYSHCKPSSNDTLGNHDDYSHCKPNSNDTLRNDDDYSHCKPSSNDTLRNDDDYSHCMPSSSTLRNDDYSHVDLKEHCKNNQQPNTNEDSSYNHIDFDDTKHPVRNKKAIVDEN